MPEMAADYMKVPISETMMVGDRLYTDIRMANDAGIKSLLVLTGEATRDDLLSSEYKPDYITGSVADINILPRF